MTITIAKTILSTVKVNRENLKVSRTNQRDIDSTNLVVYYNDQEIAHGHLNNSSNMAHITMYLENQELEDYLVYAIENRTILIN